MPDVADILSEPAAAPAMENVNVAGFSPLLSPVALNRELPSGTAVRETVGRARRAVQDILSRRDDRLLVIVGPCSVHDVDAAREYAQRLKKVADQVQDRMLVVMRVYFEKPRTTTGWKGLINDPFLYSDKDFDMETGLRLARKLLLDIAELGVPAATEFLDPFTPQYLDDLVCWAAIGARTTESQTHRQMASGLSMPVGFKNATTGDLQVAIDAMKAALAPHAFLGIDDEGRVSVVQTRGNAYGHVILRGGNERSNYHPEDIAAAATRLEKAGLAPVMMVDCSHANSGKKHERQEVVWDSILDGRVKGDDDVIGLMLESNLEAGNQPMPPEDANLEGRRSALKYGVSVTDACTDWATTQRLLLEGAARLRDS